MGCDFYIQIYLEIVHTGGIAYCKLPVARGYYPELDCGLYDSDDDEKDHYYHSEEYQMLSANVKKLCLTPRKPVVIYENNSFVNGHFEEKYLSVIQDKINQKQNLGPFRHTDTGILTNLNEIIKITKKEIKYDPADDLS